ncbi:MAG: peptide chain release factor N(5)-glutamine methyltransferase [Motiliproteus sp.]
MALLTIAQALAHSASLGALSDSPDLDLQLLLEQVLSKPRSYLYTWPEKLLTEPQQLHFEQLLARRQQGEPIAHILGRRDFWTLSLEVNSSTLIPRPDTERLVELALQLLANGPFKVADLGTGTGAIALSLASERPGWEVLAVDRVEEAVVLAERNRQQLSLNNVRVLQGSWCAPLLDEYRQNLDMIVSNPPYIDPQDPHLDQGDVRFEPRSALVADNAGMSDIETIARQALECLKPGAWLLFEHGYDQGLKVRQCLLELDYLQVETFTDLDDRDRVTAGCRPQQTGE